MIAIGNFFFKWRNYLFPLFVVALFIFRAPEPLFFGSIALEHLKDLAALGLVILGLAIRGIVIGFAYIKRGGMNKKVYADTLVTEGMFVLCRNPLYLGNMTSIIGIFLLHGDLLVVAIGCATYIFIYQCIIFAEEAYLQKKFGKDFTQYCKKTPRWFPVVSRFKKATKKMAFSWKRVMVKDYSTIATTLIAAAAVELYEYWSPAPISLYQQSLMAFIALCTLSVLTISLLKKKKGVLKVS
jgi:protein-S-isoprenylcysteine O-methyltransferase Ste14